MKFKDILNRKKFKNGDKVYLKSNAEDKNNYNKLYTVSSCDSKLKKCIVTGENGKSQNVDFKQITHKEPEIPYGFDMW